jgi:hypothetical protein
LFHLVDFKLVDGSFLVVDFLSVQILLHVLIFSILVIVLLGGWILEADVSSFGVVEISNWSHEGLLWLIGILDINDFFLIVHEWMLLNEQ